MKIKTLLALVCIAFSLSATARMAKFIDAAELGIHGYTKQTDVSPYYRFDHTPYDFHPMIVEHAKKPAGLYVAFKTNSSSVSAQWEVVPMNTRDNMPFIMQHGLDLYMKVNGEWRFVMAPRIPCKLETATYKRTIVNSLPEGENEFLLYLPIWCEMKSLKIGVDADAQIEGMPTPFKHKVIVFGSSITHGAAASRAGLTYTAQMSRNLGIDFVNFGFAGQSKMQPEFLAFLKTCEADAFLFDTFSNSSSKVIEARLEEFIMGIRKSHPGKPLIFMQTAIPCDNGANTKQCAGRSERNATARRMMAEMVKKYKDVYFLEVENVTGVDGTIDNVHPNDLGFNRYVNAYQPMIAKILKQYGIKGK